MNVDMPKCRLARLSAEPPIDLALSGSCSTLAIAAASDGASLGSAKYPVTPSWITSGKQPTVVATTGRPQAIHSNATRETASLPMDLMTPIEHSFITLDTSA